MPPGSEKKKRRKKGGRGERDGEAPTAAAPSSGALPLMRIVSYFGHWICNCGKESALWDTCACGQARLSCPLRFHYCRCTCCSQSISGLSEDSCAPGDRVKKMFTDVRKMRLWQSADHI
jgi:hypothetical protein